MLVCRNICSSCERTIFKVKLKGSDRSKAIARLKRSAKCCKEHPDVPLIRHVRPEQYGEIGPKEKPRRLPGYGYA